VVTGKPNAEGGSAAKPRQICSSDCDRLLDGRGVGRSKKPKEAARAGRCKRPTRSLEKSMRPKQAQGFRRESTLDSNHMTMFYVEFPIIVPCFATSIPVLVLVAYRRNDFAPYYQSV